MLKPSRSLADVGRSLERRLVLPLKPSEAGRVTVAVDVSGSMPLPLLNNVRRAINRILAVGMNTVRLIFFDHGQLHSGYILEQKTKLTPPPWAGGGSGVKALFENLSYDPDNVTFVVTDGYFHIDKADKYPPGLLIWVLLGDAESPRIGVVRRVAL